MAEIFQKRDQNIKHVELSIAAHRMRFLGIAARFEPTIAGVQHRSVWPGLMEGKEGSALDMVHPKVISVLHTSPILIRFI